MQAPSIRDVSRLDRLIGRRLAVRRAVTPRRGVTKVRQQLRASEALPFPGLYKPRPEPARWQFSDFENWTLGDPLPSQQESAAGAPSRQPGDIPLGASADGANPRTAQKAGPSGAGSIMEQRKLTFTLQRWESHQSQDRYMRHIRSFFTSSTLSSLSRPLGVLTLAATIPGFYDLLVDDHLLPSFFHDIHTSDSPLNLTACALALLLVFRTDNSYARFQEALGTWVDLKTESKNLIRNYFSWVKDRRLQTMVLRWTVAFSRTLAVQVRAQSDLPAQLDGILKPNEIARLMGSSNKPQYILQVLTELMHQGGLPDQREQRVLESVQAFNTASATCEKLLKYPIPLPYTRHTSRFMMMWLAFLPYSLWDSCGWLSVPITTIISYMVLGIDEIGVQIEEPFKTMPLEELCVEIQRELLDVARSTDNVTSLLAETSLASAVNDIKLWRSHAAAAAAAAAAAVQGGAGATAAAAAAAAAAAGIVVVTPVVGAANGAVAAPPSMAPRDRSPPRVRGV